MADQKTFGLNDYGFTVPSLDTLIAETKESLIAIFGETFNTQSNSIVDKLTTILNEREYQLILLGQAIYASGTLAGAEGIYLDELLGRRGVYRRGKTKSTGSIEMAVNATVPYNLIYTPDSFTVDNGTFILTGNTTVAGSLIAQQILNSDLVLGKYTFQVLSSADNSMKSMSVTLRNKTPGSTELNTFLYSIKDFIVTNTTDLNADLIYVDSAAGALYIGYNSTKELIGLNSRIDFRSSPIAGTRTLQFEVVAVEAGVLTREANTVTQISPTPSGFISLNNMTSFADGADVETDNEYKIRAMSITSEASKATRPAVISALLGVEGVQKVKIFANNTDQRDQYGVPAYKFEPVVYGGVTEQISQALYNTIALSNGTYGNTFYDITTEDDTVERIYHSKASSTSYNVLIRYQGKVLSSTEQDTIRRAIKLMTDGLTIADTLYNIQLIAAVAGAVSAGRFTQLTAAVKKASEPTSAYTSSDVVLGMREVFALDTANILFQQIT
ncbi:hypothetical protein Hena1_01590 [Erwinia phage Hena1]|uniref:Uncharacterized protein n=1 Tax=Erwinia phage Hena1 TaxID=2678601 RepID=A0A6B9J9W4_9CAUD|nr:baseplate wedge subunit [Erwinia phage Hena1]QGZ16309.1 hypothetical protein Hena1_01590 [Erwinia phage Hena1]